MVNRYDNPAEYKPVNSEISQYVQMPFEEINYALASRQKKKDAEIADIDAQSKSLNIAALAEHTPARENFVNKYNKKFTDLLDSGIDPTSVEFARKKKVILDELSRDPHPGIFKRAIEARKKDLENIEKQKNEGTYREYNRATEWQNGSPLDENGNPNELIYQPAFRGEDHDAFWHKIFEQKKADAMKSGGITGIDPTTGAITYGSSGYKGVYESNLSNSIGSANINSYLSSAAGQDYIRMLKNTKPDISYDEIKQAVKQKAQGLMQSYLYNESESDNNLKFMPKYAVDANQQAIIDSKAPVTFDPATPNAHQGDMLDIEFNEDGTIKTEKTITNVNGNTVGPTAYVGGSTSQTTVKKTPEEIAKNKYALDALRKADKEIYGDQKNYKARTDKELVEDHNAAIANSAFYVPYNKNFAGKKGDLMTEQVTGGSKTIQNLNGQRLQLLGAEGGGQLNFGQLEEMTGKPTHVRTQGRAMNNPDLPGGVITSISTEDGKNIKVVVGADKETEQYYSQYVPVFIDALGGKSGRHKMGDATVITHSTPRRKGTYNVDKGESPFLTKVTVITPGGTEKMSLQQFEQRINDRYEKKYPHLQTSGFITNKEEEDIVDDDTEN